MKKIIATLLAAFAIAPAFAQLQQVQPADTLVYEKSSKDIGPFGGNDWTKTSPQEVKVSKAGDQIQYQSSADRQFFDLKSFALTVVMPPGANQPVINSNRQGDALAVGTKWNNIITSAPRLGSKCPTNLKLEYTAMVASEGSFELNVNGKAATVKTVTIKQEGTWSAPDTPACRNGKAEATIVYAPELGVVVSQETLAHVDTKSVGDRKTLKEIKSAN